MPLCSTITTSAITTYFRGIQYYGRPPIFRSCDGSSSPICKPPGAASIRQHFRSVTLQGTCRENMQFIDVSVGCSGHMHDTLTGHCEFHIFKDSGSKSLQKLKCVFSLLHFLKISLDTTWLCQNKQIWTGSLNKDK